MTVDWISLAAAALGATGTGLLYKGSFAFLQPGSFLLSQEMNRQVKASNARRRRLQRAGLAFLMASFVVQGVGALL